MPMMPSFRDFPTARKIAFFSALISIASLITAVTAISLYGSYNANEKARNDLLILSNGLSERSSMAIAMNDHASAMTALKSLAFINHIVSGCIYTSTAESRDTTRYNVVASYPSESTACSRERPAKTRVTGSIDAEYIEIVQPVSFENTVVGYVYLRSNVKKMMGLQSDYSIVNAIIATFVSLIALSLSIVVSWWISRPLLSLARTAQNITRDDNYSLRAAEFGNDDVVGIFNKMLDFVQLENIQVRESEEKFRLISESSKVGIFQLDTNGNCVYANTELATIAGLTVKDILTNNWLAAIHPEDLASVEDQWHAMLEKGQPIYLDCRLKTPRIKSIAGYVGVLRSPDNLPIGYLGTVNDISEIKNAQSQLEQMAFYDMLTGLANRRLFRNRLEHLVNNLNKEKSNLGLILVDLDSFKSVNDSLGHDSGDKLLKIIAGRLQQCVRASDTIARLGSDEFAIILPGINSSAATAHVAEKVLAAIQEPISINENEQRITASIGISIAPQNGTDAKTVIKNADLALFHAKNKGRNNYQFFTAEMNIQLMNNLTLIRDLRHAVNSNDFTLAYQPKICIKQGKLVGFEALIRWNHKARGIVGPIEFIPVAEETGLIIPLGRWVITTACKQLRAMYDANTIDDSVSMAVNLSAHQFQDEKLVDFIADRISTFDLKPGQFEIELTESVLMENFDSAIEKLEALRELGILISIDDFGTGYSSLGYLKRLPVNTIKVDRSFVTDIPNDRSDMEMTSAVIAMAHNLHYKVVAEGVETEQQLQFLEQSDCDYGQGFFFSRPLPEDSLQEFCATFSLARLRPDNSI
jgi:diguanylate cyclase (GGDEF)-like protein/PAS domain S-box-containing protein